MNRLTRIVNPFTTLQPTTHRFSTANIPQFIPLVKSLSYRPLISSPPLLSYAHRREFFLLAAGRRKMDDASSPAIDTYAPENDDFVTVEARDLLDDNTNPIIGDVIVRSDIPLENQDRERGVLPDDLARNVVVLTCDNVDGRNCDVYLIGTAHVSQESCKEVQAVINRLKPEVVFLELCPSRVAILTLKDLKVPTMSEMIDMWKKKQNIFGILYSWFLAKVADKLEVLPGSEFRVAFEEAMKYGAKVILGDRPVHVTLRRTWGKMPLWHKIKLLYSLLSQAVFLPSPEDLNRMLKEMDDVDMLTLVIQEMSKEFPTLMETLVNERDEYMSSTLLKVASEYTSIVAVVGKGHLPGIKRNWKHPIEISKLLEMPSKSPILKAVKILTTVGVAAAGVAIISGIYFASKKQS